MPIGDIQPPVAFPDDEPLVCVAINAEWIPYLIGALRPMRYPEYWSGTLEENRHARRAVANLLDQLMQAEECDNVTTIINCCPEEETIKRFNPITGETEISKDGGTTWEVDPHSIQTQIVMQPSPVDTGTAANKCDAATNGWEHIEDIIAGVSDNLATAGTVFELAVAVAEIILVVAIALITGGAGSAIAIEIAALIWGAATAAFEAGKEAFDAYWTQEERDKILCALYCTIGDTGQFTDAQYQSFLARWRTDATPSVAFNMVISSVMAVGVAGLNNLCSYGNHADADCAACDCNPCEGEWDFTKTFLYPGATYNLGTKVNGSGLNLTTPQGQFGDLYAQVTIMFSQPCTARYWQATTLFPTGQHGQVNMEFATEIVNGVPNWASGSGFNVSDTVPSGSGIFTPDENPVPRIGWRLTVWDGGYQTGGTFLRSLKLQNEVF